VPAVVGVPLAVATRVMADRDLERMGVGRVDPPGREETWAAWRRAGNALALNLLGPVAMPPPGTLFLPIRQAAQIYSRRGLGTIKQELPRPGPRPAAANRELLG
jgi:hypothetical protein